MTHDCLQAALPFVGWARVFSPSVSLEARGEVWRELDLPGSFAEIESEYWATFHVGLPMPTVPLLLHAALGLEGADVREDWMRVFQFLGLRWEGPTLPPDHLAAVCEALATAVNRNDTVLIRELLDRYLLPWCEQARTNLAREAGMMGQLVAHFESDLLRLTEPTRAVATGN